MKCLWFLVVQFWKQLEPLLIASANWGVSLHTPIMAGKAHSKDSAELVHASLLVNAPQNEYPGIAESLLCIYYINVQVYTYYPKCPDSSENLVPQKFDDITYFFMSLDKDQDSPALILLFPWYDSINYGDGHIHFWPMANIPGSNFFDSLQVVSSVLDDCQHSHRSAFPWTGWSWWNSDNFLSIMGLLLWDYHSHSKQLSWDYSRGNTFVIIKMERPTGQPLQHWRSRCDWWGISMQSTYMTGGLWLPKCWVILPKFEFFSESLRKLTLF